MIPRTWLLSPEGATAMSENIAVALVFLLVLLSVLIMLPGMLLAAPPNLGRAEDLRRV